MLCPTCQAQWDTEKQLNMGSMAVQTLASKPKITFFKAYRMSEEEGSLADMQEKDKERERSAAIRLLTRWTQRARPQQKCNSVPVGYWGNFIILTGYP